MEKKPCIIVDLEGTLTDCSHRIHHYENKDYEAWNRIFPMDPVNEEFMKHLKAELAVEDAPAFIICTAKQMMYRNDVCAWLTKYDIPSPDRIIYRKTTDKRPSVEVKEEQLKKVQEEGYEVLRAYDDRQDIREMYQEHSIITPTDWIIEKPLDPEKLDIPEGLKKPWERDEEGVITQKSFTKHIQEPTKLNHTLTPQQHLRHSADVFEERNLTYGSSYKHFGKIVDSLFPDGIELKAESDMNRYGVLNMIIGKLQRYCRNFNKGGHSDSLTDLSTYAAMLNELDEELK